MPVGKTPSLSGGRLERQLREIPRGKRGKLESPVKITDVEGPDQESCSAYVDGGHDPYQGRRWIVGNGSDESLASKASTCDFELSRTASLSPVEEGSEESSRKSSPVKLPEDGRQCSGESSRKNSLAKTTIGGDACSPEGKKAGRNSAAKLILMDERFGQENLNRWFKLWKVGAVLERSLRKGGSDRIGASARVNQGGGARGEAAGGKYSSPAKSTEEVRGGGKEGNHVYLKNRNGADVKVLRIGSALFDIEETHESPQSSSVSREWLCKNHENRSKNSKKFAEDVETLSKKLIRVVDGNRVGKTVDSDIYFNGVPIAKRILPSSDVAGVRKVQSGSEARIVNVLEILAMHVRNLNYDEVPPRALINNVIDNLESYIGTISDRKTFLRCMFKADASSLRYLIKEVVRGAVDREIDVCENRLSKLAFGEEFDKDGFWPDEATRNEISSKESSLDKVNDFL